MLKSEIEYGVLICAYLAYYFTEDGRLYSTRYILTEPHSNEDLYISDYEKIRSAITKKYGEPLLDFDSWSDEDKESYYKGREGTALEYGYLSYYTIYSLEETTISMIMSADNYEVSTTITYESKNLDPGEADYSDDF